jgi:dTDP-4-dehydrorhamnose 3,5-epimerase
VRSYGVDGAHVYGFGMDALEIDGAWVFTPRIHRDRRGSFHEWFRESETRDIIGHRIEIAQASCSSSVRGVTRGIHFAKVPPGQAKYVTCMSGAVLDVIVDVRVGSPGYGRWVAVSLNDETRCAIFVAEGLGHSFITLSDEATMLYLCSTPYAPAREHGVNPLDPELAIAWPEDVPVILSDKDASAPSLEEARSAGLLPDYNACLIHARGLRSS